MRPSRIATVAAAWLLAALAIAPPAFALDAAAPAASSADWRPPVQKILRDVRRIPAPPGIDETRAVRIGGIDQWISVRGKDRRNPILLFIHGGPASTEMPVSWLYQSGWEDYFTVVQWDQRGAGKTYVANDPARTEPTLAKDRMVADGEELVAWLRTTYGKQKIFVLGHSWGSIIGLELARKHPDWLHAYIGMGQMIYGRDNERLGYEWALQAARADHNDKAVAQLLAIAPYPRADGSVSVDQIITQRTWVIHYGGLTWGRPDFDYAQDAAKFSPEYTRQELNPENGIGESLPRLLPAMMAWDVRGVTRLDCPVFIFAGRHDYETPSALAETWLAALQAPRKGLVQFDKSAHMMELEEPGKVLVHLVNDVRPIAEDAGDVSDVEPPRRLRRLL
ncbi:alpha/beta fold hydrolase [Scleromatobacter humisilvae]|uniref:Proline iminopeptidase n=1 Tax=Scleromatobacter humisilvae TaxID=2897159 RepID=A0A9X2C1A8_9BURK|nr:alpha/beta hydrolase [Scleromatobacter humisilvae]MCK9687376.1 alpha/beta hydrolase [Scleromatobacter humisilvae]